MKVKQSDKGPSKLIKLTCFTIFLSNSGVQNWMNVFLRFFDIFDVFLDVLQLVLATQKGCHIGEFWKFWAPLCQIFNRHLWASSHWFSGIWRKFHGKKLILSSPHKIQAREVSLSQDTSRNEHTWVEKYRLLKSEGKYIFSGTGYLSSGSTHYIHTRKNNMVNESW